MIFGEVPYKSKTIDDLLYDISSVGPSFFHNGIKISENLKNLLRALLHPDPNQRIPHNDLFEIVLNDPNFVNNYSSQNMSKIQNNGQENRNMTSTKPNLQTFIEEVTLKREKYSFLIQLAHQTLSYKTYFSLINFKKE
jgi:serine/threonine protein kinase